MLGNDSEKWGVNNKYLEVWEKNFTPYFVGTVRLKYTILWDAPRERCSRF